jgi:hypothetical protein
LDALLELSPHFPAERCKELLVKLTFAPLPIRDGGRSSPRL